MIDGLGYPVVSDVVGGRFSAEHEMITDVLLDKPVAVVAADDRVGGVQAPAPLWERAGVALGAAPTKDQGDLIRLTDGPVATQQPPAQTTETRPPMEDQVVAVLDLGKEQTVPAAGV